MEASMGWTENDITDQSGRTAIITGANSGIGFETARALTKAGAHVVMACRNPERGQAAVAKLVLGQPNAKIELGIVDLSDLSSIREFAAEQLAKHSRLDLLINNAGVMMTPYTKTADGFELQFGTNHLGHFALTGLLLERLQATSGSRVVNVASLAHKFGKMRFDDLQWEKRYDRTAAYGQSKLSNLLFSSELQRRLSDSNSSVMALSAHPGWTATNLQNTVSLFKMMNPIFAMKPMGGALPTLFAATSAEAEPNGYYGPSGLGEIRGAPGPAKRAKKAQDSEAARRLWDVSQELTGVHYL
ncbi:MAG: NAD(P)-dependent dehydrogenase (short-subunit alcohol dehydrogenase family) [Myxococcota bacterium]|jgi:NAD(P)-dependent dehydrogenase (short-subunit alcohol dehydrogenase family)